MIKNIIYAFSLIFVFMLMVSCGGGTDSTQIFDTVSLTASYDGDIYEADVFIKEDADGDGVCDSLTFTEDDVSINVKSDQKQNAQNSFPVVINSYSVTFNPLGNSPPVPDKNITAGWKIPPGSSVNVPVRVINQEDKMSFSHPLGAENYIDYVDSGKGFSYEYTITVRLNGEEQFSGKNNIIEVQFSLNYQDLQSEGESSCLVPEL